jgi:hypothetical protein
VALPDDAQPSPNTRHELSGSNARRRRSRSVPVPVSTRRRYPVGCQRSAVMPRGPIHGSGRRGHYGVGVARRPAAPPRDSVLIAREPTGRGCGGDSGGCRAGVDAKDAKQLPAPADQEMVQALPAHGANPALGDGIGVGRLDRCADDLGADARRMSSKTRVSLLSRSRTRNRTVVVSPSRVARRLWACWATQAPVGLAVTPARWTRRVCSWMKNSTYSRCPNTVSTVRKSQARMPAAC